MWWFRGSRTFASDHITIRMGWKRDGMNRLAVLCVVLVCRASAFGLGTPPVVPAQGSADACSRGGASRLSMTAAGGGGDAAKRALCVLASGFEEVSGR